MSSEIMLGTCWMQAPEGLALTTLHVFSMAHLHQFILAIITLFDHVLGRCPERWEMWNKLSARENLPGEIVVFVGRWKRTWVSLR